MLAEPGHAHKVHPLIFASVRQQNASGDSRSTALTTQPTERWDPLALGRRHGAAELDAERHVEAVLAYIRDLGNGARVTITRRGPPGEILIEVGAPDRHFAQGQSRSI